MPTLDTALNDQTGWNGLLTTINRRVEVDLQEVERVIEVARRTPGLAEYGDELQKLAVFFTVATQSYMANDPGGLSGLVDFWDRYRAVVTQRYASVTPVELRAADKVVRSIFQRFLDGVPSANIAYSPDAAPLVFGGQGGLTGYFTHPPGWNRPFAIISLPHAAFDNVWQWLALAHEAGHDTYASVTGLPADVESALDARMRRAVTDNEVAIPDVDVDLNPFGVPYRIQYSGADFLAKIWTAWANESQADIVGLLSCGGAATVALQQIIGFTQTDSWEVFNEAGTIADGPEAHPTSYIRNEFNIAALEVMHAGHAGLARQIRRRFEALHPGQPDIVWSLGGTVEVARVPVAEMATSAGLAAEVLINQTLPSLGSQSYRDLGFFSPQDQDIVDEVALRLAAGDPTFANTQGATPRHALAATVFALEAGRAQADVINRTFMHFV